MLFGPVDEVFDVGGIRVAPVVLTPGELAVQQTNVYRWHLHDTRLYPLSAATRYASAMVG